MDRKNQVRTDCINFKGHIPCKPHKEKGVHCEDCEFYSPIKSRILIIKLGAIGDVVRTTPLVNKLKQVYPNCEISWLTYSPEILPENLVRPLKFDSVNIVYLMACEFDLLINLDKDNEAISLANLIRAKEKKGFKLENGKCFPIDDNSYHKYMTGLFDDISRENTRSYIEEIFEICGFEFKGEKYILNPPQKRLDLPELDKPVIGLNTGCGRRWPSRLWGRRNWEALISKIRDVGFTPLLLGGPDEDELNKEIAKDTGAYYFGTFPLMDFIQLVNICDVVITQVTMALHLAIGLNKKIVLLNNIFNKKEFDLYGLGTILEPSVNCKGCYKPRCETRCMDMISPDNVFDAVSTLMESSVLCDTDKEQ